ncbi:polysaccharide lyase 8 family protein [Paenibacillus oryzisoli]|uniref:polysaccharide lyase 8 family protein n=1 Tax=Paenibacillus oryzisoli TaxID=1850517 RepID=UPI003D270FB1
MMFNLKRVRSKTMACTLIVSVMLLNLVIAFMNPHPAFAAALYEDFNAQTTGAAPSGWTLTGTGGTALVANVPDSVNKSLKLTDTSTTQKIEAAKSFSVSGDIYTVEFDVMSAQTNMLSAFYLSGNAGLQAVTVAFDETGHVYTYYGATKTTIQTYSANTWYHIKIVARPADDTFDLYIDNVLKSANQSLKNDVTSLTNVKVATATAQTGTVYWDNISADAASAPSSEYADLRSKWRNFLTGGSYSVSDPDIAAQLTALTTTASDYYTALNTSGGRTYLWADLDDATTSVANTKSSYMTLNYERLEAMALAYASVGSSLYHDTGLLADIIDALDWLYANKYNETKSKTGNWFDWEIGTPLTLNNTTMLLYDQLTSTQIANYMNAVDHFSPSATTANGGTATGANRVWKAKVVGIRGIIVESSTKIAAGRDALTQVFNYVTSGDGFYTDGSFIQHTGFAYTGGYGNSLLREIVPFMYVFDGSTWAVVSANSQNLYKWVYDSFEPLIYKGAMMDMSRGRGISRRETQDHAVGNEAISAILQLSQIAPPSDAANYKSMVKYWIQTDTFRNYYTNAGSIYHIAKAKEIVNDAGITARAELVTSKQFPAMDRAVHLRPGFGFSLALSSSRIKNYESINSENLKGWYTGDGMTYLYNNDLGQYSDEFWGLVNKYRLPGTTVDTQTRSNASGQGYLSSKNWVGGTTNGSYGVSGMELDAYSSTLTAKKSWFMFDDEIVALGAGITSTDNRTIETTIENRKINSVGNNAFTVNGTAKSTALTWSEAMTGVNWMHLAGNVTGSDIGYYFPTGTSVKGLREARTGTWASVNTYAKSIDNTSLTRNFLTLWIDHGANPTNVAYSYVLLPNKTSTQVSNYAASPNITVLENSTSAQAVKETGLNAVGANFWTDTAATINVGGSAFLSSNKKASILTKESTDEIELNVSDPTQANTGTIQVEINRSASSLISSDPAITVTQLSPTIKVTVNVNGAKGQTFKALFDK